MRRNYKKTTALSLVIVVALSLAVLSQMVNAQTDVATIVIPSVTGGTTDPAPGTYTSPNGTVFTVTATPAAGFAFQYWIISGDYTPGHTGSLPGFFTDPETGEIIQVPPRIDPATIALDSLAISTNPFAITCGYGYTYQYTPVFAAVGSGPSPAPTANDAVVVMMPTTGGTTSPATGTYVYANGTTFTLSATPNPGYVFHYWVVAGNNTPGHVTSSPAIIIDPETGAQIGAIPRPTVSQGLDSLIFANPTVTITCGYGYTYQYLAVFDPAVNPSPSATVAPTPTPTQASTPSPTATAPASVQPTATPGAPGGIGIEVIAAIIVVIIIIIVVIAAVMMRKKK